MKKVSSFWLSLAIISQCIKSLIQKLQTVSPVGTNCKGSSNSRRGRILASRRIVFSDQRTFSVSAYVLFLCIWWGPLESHIYCWSETSDLLLGTFPRLTRNGRMYFFYLETIAGFRGKHSSVFIADATTAEPSSKNMTRKPLAWPSWSSPLSFT